MIWIDVVNQPHVRFWRRFLYLHDGKALITTRKKGNLTEMASLFLGDVVEVGRWGVNKLDKLLSFADRVLGLTELIKGEDIEVAMSKGSTEQARVAFGLGIPLIVGNDNDLPPYTVSKLTFPLASLTLIPSCYGGPTFKAREVRFSGIYEVSHVLDYLERGPVIKFDHEREYIVARPPPVKAFYHEADLERYVLLVRKISEELGLDVIYIPRAGERPVGFHVPKGVVDGLDLLAKSSLVLGGGGTMTREAALLGVPTVSLFPEGGPCVTDVLEGEGLLIRARWEDVMEAVKKAKALDRDELRERTSNFIRGSQDPAEVLNNLVAERAWLEMSDRS